jgi:hypothetical protein
MNRLLFLNTLRWYIRLPIKWLLFGLAVLAVCFPYPRLLVRHLGHWRNPNALLEPDAPALGPLIKELESRLEEGLDPFEAQVLVEEFVYEKVPYDWDWNIWGTADYLPTVTEAIEKGREDCDGRAVIAASLLRHFGYRAQIVTDFAHVWVRTDYGETMGPGKAKTLIADEEGLKLQPAALYGWARALAYGVAPFPFIRELIILGMLWWLVLPGKAGLGRPVLSLVFLVNGLLFLRSGGRDYYAPTEWMQIVGLVNILAGLVVVWIRPKANVQACGETAQDVIQSS